MKWWYQMPWSSFFECWVLSQLFHSPLSKTFIKQLFSYSLLSVIRVVSSAYLRLLIFLLAILNPAWDSSSPTFCMMYSVYKLNKQGDNIQPGVLLSQLGTSPLFQVRWSGSPISLRIFHTVKGFSVVSELKVYVKKKKYMFFLKFPCFFYDPMTWWSKRWQESALTP